MTTRLGLVDLRGARPVEWIELPRGVAWAYWSPDGGRIIATTYAYTEVATRPGQKMCDAAGWAKGSRSGFVLVDVSTRTSRFIPLATRSHLIEDVDIGSENLLWTPGGRGVLGNDLGRNQVSVHGLDGRLQRSLPGVVLTEAASTPFSPDGKSLIVGRRTTPGPYPDVIGLLDVQTGTFSRQLIGDSGVSAAKGSVAVGGVLGWLYNGRLLGTQDRIIKAAGESPAESEGRMVLLDAFGRVTHVLSWSGQLTLWVTRMQFSRG